ncbi:hypothetical protein p2A329 (plasmid) [Aromatoleum aromaticum EbN1]|uniref:MOSC domain-containing protein n=1 Tax=Aromatoleum aromaticum (strain DSM 19018 / LMG 30748 / EbN1) TaxID=76114 RepID=Q5NW79_AROAE|nr:MOSC N-terminal beta barrel domain-containing protein [Aromatoleum aromaticum]CAI10685.1 hypothetical protein p2A329 [Aromatoleum aromaticum EbN1]
MPIGRIVEIWRYPVKSMGGESITSASVGKLGIAGDRCWAVRDPGDKGEIRTARKFPRLLQCSARCVGEPVAQGDADMIDVDWTKRGRPLRVARKSPRIEVDFPDGGRLGSHEPGMSDDLSKVVGIPVDLCPLQPADDAAHHQRFRRRRQELDQEFKDMLARLPDEPYPDLVAQFGTDVMDFVTPPGTYFDAMPLHLITTAALRELERLNPHGSFDRRRFRANFVVEVDDASGFVEFDWCGRSLRLGALTTSVHIPVVRCVMLTLAQRDLPKDPSVLRTVVRHAKQNFGVYLTAAEPATVRVGDPIELI